MFDECVTILENRRINGAYFKLVFRSRPLARGVRPGQFLHIRIQDGLDPFLRRPFSYYRIRGDRVEVLYEILGKGTGLLSRRLPGDSIRVLGPLGKPFTPRPPRGRKRVIIAGGIGVPPLIFLAEKSGADYILIGARSRKEVLPGRELVRVQSRIRYATNDGSFGKKGFVTVLLKDLIKKEGAESLYLQTCGPTAMMRAVWDVARECRIPGEASMEETMACGVGACLGCMVRTTAGWIPSCTEGPVFPFEQLVWEPS